MTYTLDFAIALGSAQTGLSLEAQLVDTVGGDVGSPITAGFTEIGVGNYLWHATTIPDGHRGGVVFQILSAGAIKAFASINPEEAENTDVKVSTRSDFDEATDNVTVGSLVAGAIDSIWDEVMGGTLTGRQLMRLHAAVQGGKLSGAGTTTITIRDPGDTKDVVVATVDPTGNRTTVVLDLS